MQQERMNSIKQHFESQDPILFALLATMELKPLERNEDSKKYFQHLCQEIISQQLSGKAANAIVQRFLKLFPRKHITPQGVLKFSGDQLRAVGMSWAKVRSLLDLAEKTKNRELRLLDIPNLDDETVIEQLTQVKGIGRWTAEMFLMFTLGREDIFSFGDLALQKGLERIYGKKLTRTRKHAEKIISRWAPYRSYGSLALWHAVDSAKK